MSQSQEFIEEINQVPATQHTFDLNLNVNQAVQELQRIEYEFDNFLQIRTHIQLNPSSFELGTKICEICAQDVNLQLFEKFCCHQHEYCKQCILSILHQNLNNFKIVKCPTPECQVQLNQHSPFFFKMMGYHKAKLMKIRKNRQVLSNPKVKLCQKELCDGVLNLDKDECSLCQEKHCSKCLQLLHDGKCDKFVKGGLKRRYQFKRCPHCRMMIQKSKGCLHIKCVCGCQFCYVCGDLFSNSHRCKQNRITSALDRLRLDVVNPVHDMNQFINCFKIMQFLEPNSDRSTVFKYVYFFLLITFFYPLSNAVLLSTAIAFLSLYGAGLCIIGTLFFVLLALMEVVNLQLAPSVYLVRKGIPLWIVRILSIPLFPINLISGIYSRWRQIFCDQDMIQKLKPMFSPVSFFLGLPCLLLENEIEDELE